MEIVSREKVKKVVLGGPLEYNHQSRDLPWTSTAAATAAAAASAIMALVSTERATSHNQ